MFGMVAVIINSFLDDSMKKFPFSVKFTIPLSLLLGSLVGKIMLHFIPGSVYYFPNYMALICSVTVIEKHMIMDETFKFAYPYYYLFITFSLIGVFTCINYFN